MNPRKHKPLTPRQQRRVKRNHAATRRMKVAPGFQHLNWFDANIAAFLMEHGGGMPAASNLIFGKPETSSKESLRLSHS